MQISILNISKDIPQELIKINNIVSPFYEKGSISSAELYLRLKDSKNIDVFLKDIYNSSHKYIDEAVGMAIDYLIKLDIWDYNAERFNGKYELDFYNVDEIFEEYFYEKYQEIIETEKIIKQERAVERSSRTSWSGGGFGFTGAVKGAIQAELLNFATDAIRSVNDSMEDASDRADINRLKKGLLDDKQNLKIYSQQLKRLIQNVGWALCDFLQSKGVIDNYNFDFNTAYARYNNIVNSSLTVEEKASKIIDCILMYPYYYDFHKTLYEIEPSKSIYDIAVFFGFLHNIKYDHLNVFYSDFEPVSKMPGNSPEEINKKFNAYIKLLKKHKFMKADNSWDNDYVQSYKIIDTQNELIDVYNVLEKNRRCFNKVEYSTVEEAQKKYDEYVENKRAAKERQETIEATKSFFGTATPIVIVLAIIYGIYYMLSKSGVLSAFLEMFTSLGT